MFYQLARQLLDLRKAIAAAESPQPLALGFAVGIALGLVPKGNLLALLLSILLLSLRTNVAMGMITALAFSWIGALLDPLSHRIGLALLAYRPFQPLWAFLYNLPVIPWTKFNNTVVLGSLVLGAALFYPAYVASTAVFERCWFRRRKRAMETTESRQCVPQAVGPVMEPAVQPLTRPVKRQARRIASRQTRRRDAGHEPLTIPSFDILGVMPCDWRPSATGDSPTAGSAHRSIP